MPATAVKRCRIGQRRVPDDRRAPVPADQYRLAAAQLIGHRLQVADDGRHVVGFDRLGLVRAAIAAHVDCRGRKAGLRDRPHLVAPGGPAFREAMDHQDQRPRTAFDSHAMDPASPDWT